ncbi:hypothetical protein L2E82_32347 [Cichorium intybus]|uniref:Uncharacterized protein n=1 Tax=Cichorium intybus TaxID=13427 RepID=A0ACB9BIA8_CICIN|nr:hypothetical protein L2E82_32347 [Cichorium intybus]
MKGAFFIEGSSLCLCVTFLLLKDFFIGFWFDPKREKLYMPIKQFFHLILVFLFNSFSKMIIFESRSLLSLFSRQTGSGNLAHVSFRPTPFYMGFLSIDKYILMNKYFVLFLLAHIHLGIILDG